MKKILALALALVLALGLTACGKSADKTGGDTNTDSTEPVNVVLWTYYGDTNIGYLQKIADDFNASQSKYTVSIEFQGTQAEMNAKIQSTAASELPAMFNGAVENVAMYANADYCAPLQSYIDADKDGWAQLDGTWDSIRAAYCDNKGNQVGYPCGYSYGGIFYNEDLLTKAGINAADIQSFDDLYAACEKLVGGGYCTYGVGFHPDGFYFNAALGREGIQAYDNGNGYTGDITKCLYVDDKTVNNALTTMLTDYQKLYANNLAIAFGSDYQGEIIPQFASGDCALFLGVVSMTTKILKSVDGAFKVGIVPMVSATENGKRTGEPAGGTGTYICNNGNEAQMQGAYEFIKWMSTGDQAAFFSTSTGYLAPNKEAYDSTSYQKYVSDTFPAISTVYDSLAKSDDSANNPYIPISNEMKAANLLAIQTVTGDPTANVQDAIKTACESIQEAIDLYNAANK
ncbi:MAG: extracellular solute-binding protein [Clostridiales bacterium]|nr:extracellular solute-binding protein [Clostridiales bacterium]